MGNLKTESILFETPLYERIKLSEDEYLYDIFSYDKRVDFYSASLKENTTYVMSSASLNGSSFHLSDIDTSGGFFQITLKCVRTHEKLYFNFYYDDKVLIKYGQIPSIATLHISKVKQFDKVLTKEKLKEFTRAIGLAANGVGIGSFVYLRRIFEDLIEDAHKIALNEQDWKEDEYIKSRMTEKIALLKNYLPAFLVENKELYSILSVGVHSLTEQSCLNYFETVKLGIELILEEKAEKLEKEKRLADAKGKINQLKSTIENNQ